VQTGDRPHDPHGSFHGAFRSLRVEKSDYLVRERGKVLAADDQPERGLLCAFVVMHGFRLNQINVLRMELVLILDPDSGQIRKGFASLTHFRRKGAAIHTSP
jgi:hypothetical protein